MNCHWKLLRHRWAPRGSLPMNAYSAFGPNREIPSREFTRVLYRCDKCGALRTRDLDGHWTRRELGFDAAK